MTAGQKNIPPQNSTKYHELENDEKIFSKIYPILGYSGILPS